MNPVMLSRVSGSKFLCSMHCEYRQSAKQHFLTRSPPDAAEGVYVFE